MSAWRPELMGPTVRLIFDVVVRVLSDAPGPGLPDDMVSKVVRSEVAADPRTIDNLVLDLRKLGLVVRLGRYPDRRLALTTLGRQWLETAGARR